MKTGLIAATIKATYTATVSITFKDQCLQNPNLPVVVARRRHEPQRYWSTLLSSISQERVYLKDDEWLAGESLLRIPAVAVRTPEHPAHHRYPRRFDVALGLVVGAGSLVLVAGMVLALALTAIFLVREVLS